MKELNKKKIIKLTNITKPFLMIDSIKKILDLRSAKGIKKVSKNSWFFKCHFIDQPMMPGTLIEEAMLQTIVATLYSSKRFEGKNCLVTSSKTNFYSKVDKPTTLSIEIKIHKITKLKVETSAIVKNLKKIKVATGNYNYFISTK